MQIIVISSKDKFRSEVVQVTKMFEAGLEVFHLRKPKFSQKRMEEYIKEIPEKYHNRVVIHSFHDLAKKYLLKGIHLTKRHKKKRFAVAWRNFLLKLKRPYLTISTSCHDLGKLRLYANKYDYVMLSPVFDSISSNGGQAAYAHGAIKKAIKDAGGDKIVALGGLDATDINAAKSLGFSGIALLGTLWYSNRKPIDVYNEVVDIEIGRTKPEVNINLIKVAI